MRVHYIICWFTGLCMLTAVKAQIPVGAWRDHLSWNTAMALVVAEGKVYCSNGVGLCVYDIANRTTDNLTKLNGLSDAGISAIDYSDNSKTVIVGYLNGNIDLITADRKVYNISDIKNSSLYAAKRVNDVCTAGDKAFMACQFGLMTIDLRRRQIESTCIIGDDGLPTEIFAVTICDRSIYAATADGVKYVEIDNPLMADFSQWKKLTYQALQGKTITELESESHTIFLSDGSANFFVCEGGTINNVELPFATNVSRLRVCLNRLLIISSAALFVYDISTKKYIDNINTLNNSQISLRDASWDATGYWIADYRQGLCRWLSPSEVSSCLIGGPSSNNLTKLRYKDARIFAFIGSDSYTLPEDGDVNVFESNEWRSIRLPETDNFTDVEVDAVNRSKIYLSSWGHGVYVIENDAITEHYDATNSALEASTQGTLCGGLLLDETQRLWVTNGSRVAVLNNSGWSLSQWDAHAALGRMTADKDGQIWTTRLNNGLWVFDKAATAAGQSDKTRGFAPSNYSHTEKAYNTHGLACAPDGDVWVASNLGPVYYDNTADIMTSSATDGNHPMHTGSDDVNYMYALLGSANTLAVAVDGANRKWFGTDKGGVFLIDEDNANEVRHFTAANSPLFADKVFDIAINERNGEVFFATELGLQSFRSDAVAAGDDFGRVYVFPNPVRPDYEGEITITGLIRDADVKITDVAGNLVHQTHSLGGQAVWNGRDLKGRRVATGVYLVFCTNDDGSKTHICKLLFIK